MTFSDRLAAPNRRLRAQEGILFGPTGRRLWVDCLAPEPGFSGCVDFVHKQNIPLLFAVRAEGQSLLPMETLWRPDESRFSHENEALAFSERKLIAWDDQALSLQTWVNRSQVPLRLSLILPEGCAAGELYRFPCAAHGVEPAMIVMSDADWSRGIEIAPGETFRALIAAAVGLADEADSMRKALRSTLAARDFDALMDARCAEYNRWFDDAPRFACDDALLSKCWDYRLYILRSSLTEPGMGRLPGRCFYEGRDHRMAKTPFSPSGWSFSRLIPLSTPLQVTDARWLGDKSIARDALRALTRCADGNGIFAVTAVDECAKEYANFAGWALYLNWLTEGDEGFIREVLPAFKRDARAVYARQRRDDALQIETDHPLTGKEYQPSYWYFGEDRFPMEVRPAKVGYTPLKRVDRSVYMYLNFLGLSRLCRAAGDGEWEWFEREASIIRRDVLEKMWDGATECFYDLHHLTDEKALVRNIVAVYPFWAGMTGEEHLGFMRALLSPDYFATGSGFASAAKDCPVFEPHTGWRGQLIKGPRGCMWNGPSWPYTTGIALDALASQSKAHGHRFDADFEKHLREYVREHFPFDDNTPYLVEFYDSITGEPVSDEPDYCHSFFLDLIVRHVAGIEPGEEGVTLDPAVMSLEWFDLENVRARGRRIDVHYQKDQGYTVWVDGKIRICNAGPEDLPARIF